MNILALYCAEHIPPDQSSQSMITNSNIVYPMPRDHSELNIISICDKEIAIVRRWPEPRAPTNNCNTPKKIIGRIIEIYLHLY